MVIREIFKTHRETWRSARKPGDSRVNRETWQLCITLHVIEIKTACVHIMKLFLSKMGFKEKLKQSSSNKSPDYLIFFKFINFADETAHYMTGQKQTYIMKYSRYMTTAG